MPAIGPSQRDAPDGAGAAGVTGLAGSVAPGCAGITGCDAAPVADDAGGTAERGAMLGRWTPRLRPPPSRASATSLTDIVAKANAASARAASFIDSSEMGARRARPGQ